MSSGIIKTESNLASWISISLILMTASILFYSATTIKNPALNVHPKIAAFIAVGLITVDVLMSGTALIPYNTRNNYIHESAGDIDIGIDYDSEKDYRIMYSILTGCLVFLQVLIGVYIIKDSILRVGKLPKHRRNIINPQFLKISKFF